MTTFSNIDELNEDIARTHRSVAGSHDGVASAVTDADEAKLLEDGYLIIEDVLSAERLAEIRDEASRLLAPCGRNDFEGLKTQRLYSVLAKTASCTPLVEHPRALSLVDRLLQPNYLLSMYQVINILPGEAEQLLHCDDMFYRIPRPRPAVSAATIWAIDDFTEDNGATVVVPGSHRWGDRSPSDDDRRVKAVMRAGSVLLLLGTTWHGGGANHASSSRLAVTAQYCEPWGRTQENMFLAVPREIVRRASPIMQSLLGYSIHPPFMGNVNGMSPMRCLVADALPSR